MNNETQKTFLDMNDSESTMETILKNIYTSCDPHNLNMVPTSEIIEFIRPYMLEDLLALETLRTMLDPDNKNVPVDGDQFYNVMNEWTKKIGSHSDEDSDFNRTPNHLDVVDEKLLPYTQSTPRESFGQKLLSCQDLLNLSNVSNYNLSPTKLTKDNSVVGHEKTILEEEVKQLQYELNKVLGEMSMMKSQLAYSEEQNETLQDALEKMKSRLQSEHQVNGHLQENKNGLDDMKEEINLGKKRIEELNKKLTFFEKENNHLNMYVQKLEKENSEVEDRCVQLKKVEQNLKIQLIDIKTELDVKEHELTTVTKISEDLRIKLCEKTNEVDQLLNENELLDYKKQGLEKFISSRRYSLSSHYNTCLDEMSSFLSRGSTIPIYSSPLKAKSFYDNSQSLIKQVLSPISPNPADPKTEMLRKVLESSTPKGAYGLGMRKSFSLNAMSTRSLPNIFCLERSTVIQDQGSDADMMLESLPPDLGSNGPYESLQTELFQVDPQFDHKDKNGAELEYEEQIIMLKNENETLQKSLQILEKEYRISQSKVVDLGSKILSLVSEEELNTIERKNKAVTNKGFNDYEYILNHLKEKYDRLNSELNKKENEISQISNKFNFESAYKNLEIEYSRKISQLEELQQFHEEDKSKIDDITSKNRELLESLKKLEVKLQKSKEEYKNREILTQNIEQTASRVQAHVDDKTAIISELQRLNLQFRHKIEKLETDLNDKIRQLGHLKEILRKEEEIKNKMWKDNQDLTSSLNVLTEDYQTLLKEVGEQDNIKKELKEEYNSILSKYNKEIEKNRDLTQQISSQEKEFTAINSKYHEMNAKYHDDINKYVKFQEEMSSLRSEVKDIRESHKLFKDNLNKSLVEYHNNVQQLNSKLTDLQFENSMLLTDLNIEKQKHKKNCENHYEQKNETDLDEDKKKYVDGDASSDSSVVSLGSEKAISTNKNRSFEKQKLTIDRLKEKLENLNDDILNEKYRNEILQKRLSCKEKELQEMVNNTCSEKNSLQSIINDLRDRLIQQDDYYKHICNGSNEKIRNLSLKISQMDEIQKNTLLTVSQKDSLLQRDFEMHKFNKLTIEGLTKSLQDFQFQQKNLTGDLNAKEISLKHVTLENQNLKHLAASLENQVLELSVKLSLQETAVKTCESDLCKKDEELKALSTILLDREGRIQVLTTSIANYEQKLSSILHDLSVKDDDFTKLKRVFDEVQEQLSQMNATVTASEDHPKCIDKLQEQVDGGISGSMLIISDCCSDLNRAFTRFIEPWKRTIESDPNFERLPSLRLCKSLEITDVLSVIVHNIRTVISLFDLLCSRIPHSMEDNPESHLTFFKNPKTNMIETKTLKKFTLRPSKLHLNRPVSPDSPGIEIEPLVIEEHPESNKESHSPDSQNLRSFRMNEQGENCAHNSSNTCLPLLTFDLQIQDAFPHIPDTFLEKLGLHENSPRVKLTKDETEKLFTTFAIQVALDSKDIKDRLEKQKEICCQQHRKCLYLLKDISLRLRDHNCIGATDPINPVFVMLEDFRYQMQEMMQAVGQFGVLSCENRMTKCWNLVTNYMAIIKQNSEYWKRNSSPNRITHGVTKSPTRSLEKNKIAGETCKNCDEGDTHLKRKKEAKEEYSGNRGCLSCFTHTFIWMSFLSLLIVIGVILVHWQCKMTTEYKVCPLDDFIKVLSQRVGNPPY